VGIDCAWGDEPRAPISAKNFALRGVPRFCMSLSARPASVEAVDRSRSGLDRNFDFVAESNRAAGSAVPRPKATANCNWPNGNWGNSPDIDAGPGM
jgi:hypothetical protein